MPYNLLKKYNEFLELGAYNEYQREQSLRGVFNRDIVNNKGFKFRNRQINPTTAAGKDPMDILFTHLTTKTAEKSDNTREFDFQRSVRLHWIKYHIEEKKTDNMYIFSTKEPCGNRTYIYDKDENYVIVLEPMRKKQEYYLLSAYYLEGKDKARNKMLKKYKRRLPELL